MGTDGWNTTRCGLVEKSVENLKSLKLLYIDAGTRDEFALDLGASILCKKLKDFDIPHIHEEFDDGHFNISYRYNRSLELISQNFDVNLLLIYRHHQTGYVSRRAKNRALYAYQKSSPKAVSAKSGWRKNIRSLSRKRWRSNCRIDEQVDFEAIRQEATLWEEASGHPNVLPIIDADIYDGQVVIVSEYAEDGSLADKLKAEGRSSSQSKRSKSPSEF